MNERFEEEGKKLKVIIYGEESLKKRGNVITLSIEEDREHRLHYNTISLVLSDIFGIQVRSGCFCAGPYGMLIDHETVWDDIEIRKIVKEVEKGNLTHKPGYIRLDLPFYFTKCEISYIV